MIRERLGLSRKAYILIIWTIVGLILTSACAGLMTNKPKRSPVPIPSSTATPFIHPTTIETSKISVSKPTAAPKTSTTKPVVKTTTTTKTTEVVYYSNCTEVKAAGKAPLYRGQPGYREGLDRDHDGVACEN